MYLSLIDLHQKQLPDTMRDKLTINPGYALHQWLWQLFPGEHPRDFLFRHDTTAYGVRCHLLSARAPARHNLLRIASKPFTPKLSPGERLQFILRVNPVITRQKKRFDILQDIKHHAPKNLSQNHLRQQQHQGILNWLNRQAASRGFTFASEQIHLLTWQRHSLIKYQQHPPRTTTQQTPPPENPAKPAPQKTTTKQHALTTTEQQPATTPQPQILITAEQQNPETTQWQTPTFITFNTIDLQGILTVTDPDCFLNALASGFGKSRALGCGLMLIKRPRPVSLFH